MIHYVRCNALLDELKLYRGDDYVLPNGIHIKCPTLGEICDYGEKEYMKTISMFVSTTIERCAELDDMGIDYTEITNLEMFSLFIPLLVTQITKPLFGDFDFTRFRRIIIEDKTCLINPDGIRLDEKTFEEMTAYIRKMHGIAPPLYTKVTNAFAKSQMIIDARNDAEFHRKLISFRGERSVYQPYVSALVNHPNFKFDWHTVWDMKIYAFFDSLKRISIIENANHLYTGLYSGCIEYAKIKRDLDWLKPID